MIRFNVGASLVKDTMRYSDASAEAKDKYARRSRISKRKFRELIRYFAFDLHAIRIAELANLIRNSVNRYLLLLRLRLAEMCETQSPFRGVIEVDESYFGPQRVRGKRGQQNPRVWHPPTRRPGVHPNRLGLLHG